MLFLALYSRNKIHRKFVFYTSRKSLAAIILDDSCQTSVELNSWSSKILALGNYMVSSLVTELDVKGLQKVSREAHRDPVRNTVREVPSTKELLRHQDTISVN